jgi:C-terminal processing protease CtpA/Prc
MRDRTQNDAERLRDQNARGRDGNTAGRTARDGRSDESRTSRNADDSSTSDRTRSTERYRERTRDDESDADGRWSDADERRHQEREREGDERERREETRDRARDRDAEDEDQYRDDDRRDRDDENRYTRDREDYRYEGRDRLEDDVRDTIRGARDTARDVRDTARDAARNARETVRDVRDSVSRESRRSSQEFDVNTVRSADVGLWFNRSTRNGLVINDVASSGPIARIGFREGDRIVSVNGYRVRDERQFVRDLFDEDYRDERVAVIVDRSGTQRTIYVEPSTLVEHYVSSSSSSDPLEKFGLVLDDRYNNQLVVWKVTPRTPAYYAGVRASDLITAWNNQRVTTKDQLVRALQNASEGDEVWLTVTRNRQQRRLEAEITGDVATRTEARTTYRPVLEGESYEYEAAPSETYPTTERPRPILPNRPAVVPRPGILPRNR